MGRLAARAACPLNILSYGCRQGKLAERAEEKAEAETEAEAEEEEEDEEAAWAMGGEVLCSGVLRKRGQVHHAYRWLPLAPAAAALAPTLNACLASSGTCGLRPRDVCLELLLACLALLFLLP